MTYETLALQGKSGIPGMLAASVRDKVGGLRKESVRNGFLDPGQVEHRMEFVGNIHGIEFINDSRATTLNATWFALESQYKPVIWIAGGSSQKPDYNSISALVRQKVKAIICLGNHKAALLEVFGSMEKTILFADTIGEAVEVAYYLAETGDHVLFSPGCASFEMFENFEDRGKKFRRAVNSL